MDWFRWHHGTCTDPKFAGIARRCGAPKCVVLAVWAMCLESASEGDDRGRLKHDADEMGAALDLETGLVSAILSAMEEKGLLAEGRVAKWDKRQFKSDDVTARVRDSREKKRAGNVSSSARNVPVTPPDTDTESETEKKKTARKRADEIPPGFDGFWDAYPRKTAKPAALKAYRRALAKGAKSEEILAGLETYKRTKPDYADWCHPATFLNDERWKDEPSPAAKTLAAAAEAGLIPQRPDAEYKLRKFLQAYKPGGFWPREILNTYPPEHPDTTVPLALLIEFGFRAAA